MTATAFYETELGRLVYGYFGTSYRQAVVVGIDLERAELVLRAPAMTGPRRWLVARRSFSEVDLRPRKPFPRVPANRQPPSQAIVVTLPSVADALQLAEDAA